MCRGRSGVAADAGNQWAEMLAYTGLAGLMYADGNGLASTGILKAAEAAETKFAADLKACGVSF